MSRHQQQIIRDCAKELTLTVSELLTIAKTAPKRYYVWEINKRSGKGKRTVCHPARELKLVQYHFLNKILHDLPVHICATAYVSGSSIKKNAEIHCKSRVIMKLDFSNFFNSLKVSDWRLYAADYFPDWTEDEIDFSSRILFWGSGTYTPKCLAIGSPTSPALSNALMYDVDVKLADFANRNNVKYTRYADDITFSSENFLNYNEIISEVKNALKASKYTNVTINNKKTILISNSSSRRVTGLIITPNGKISLGRERKRLISSMAHHYKLGKLPNEKRQELSGLLAFALDAEPEFIESLRKKYTQDVIDRALKSTVEGFVT